MTSLTFLLFLFHYTNTLKCNSKYMCICACLFFCSKLYRVSSTFDLKVIAKDILNMPIHIMTQSIKPLLYKPCHTVKRKSKGQEVIMSLNLHQSFSYFFCCSFFNTLCPYIYNEYIYSQNNNIKISCISIYNYIVVFLQCTLRRLKLKKVKEIGTSKPSHETNNLVCSKTLTFCQSLGFF